MAGNAESLNDLFFFDPHQVKVLYVRNLTVSLTEEKLRESFEAFGKVDRVKKIKDYAFVHFEDRQQAIAAMNALNRLELPLNMSLVQPRVVSSS